jgi:hypothetical protein
MADLLNREQVAKEGLRAEQKRLGREIDDLVELARQLREPFETPEGGCLEVYGADDMADRLEDRARSMRSQLANLYAEGRR